MSRPNFNEVETRKLLEALKTEVFKDNFIEESERTDGDILWHFSIKNPFRGKTIFDEGKNEYRIRDWDIHVSIEAGVNPNGVGDKKEPATALTYSVRLGVSADRRQYRTRTWYEKDYVGGYVYSRTLEGVIERVKEELLSKNGIYVK